MEPLRIDVHLQDDEQSCGRACAQMVIRFLAGRLFPQASFQSPHPRPGWSTTPEQLCDMVNGRSPADGPQYVVRAVATLSRAMAYTQEAVASGLPAVAMTHSGGHWVVIRGFTQRANRTTIVHLWDPVPALTQTFPGHPAEPVPLHADDDRCYGRNFELANGDEIAVWTDWKDQFLPCTTTPQNPWAGQFVVVVPQSATTVGDPAFLAEPERQGEVVVSAAQAAALAVQGINDSGLLDRLNWRETFAGALLPPPAPLLVHRLDKANDAYYLVSMPAAGGRGALMGIDAFSGALRFARLNPSLQYVERLFAPLTDINKSLPPGSVVTGRVVWTPSEQASFSPYFPFAEVRNADASPLFVRLSDRRRFATLATRSGQPPN